LQRRTDITADNVEFDFQKALKGIQEGKPFTGKDGVLTSLIKNLALAALEAELDSHTNEKRLPDSESRSLSTN